MIIWEVLNTSVKKCHWLHSKYIHSPRIKSRFGMYVLKLEKNFNLPYSKIHQEISLTDLPLLSKLFTLWLSDISKFSGKRHFLKEQGGKGQKEDRGKKEILWSP